jgi:polar amino acid transport system substrate-binding protein
MARRARRFEWGAGMSLRNWGKGLLCGLVVAAGLAVAVRPAAAEALDDVLAAKVIRIAVPQDFPPFGSAGPDLQPQGYDIDMANLIAQDLGVTVELVPVTSANRLPYLQTHKVDLIISSLGRNAEREKVIDFTSAYAPFFSGVFGPADSTVAKVEDLAGKTVGVTRGALEDLAISKIAPADADIERFEDNNTTIAAFLSGQTELIATGNVVAAAILARDPAVRPEPKFILSQSPCFIGLNKGEPKLLAKVNAIIAAARQDGRLDAISKKWLGAGLPGDLPV